MDKLSSIHQQKVSILTRQLDQLRVNQKFLEDALQQAKSSIQSPSDVQFLLSRPDIVSTLETEESYSMVLEPEAQFLPKFTKEKKDRRVRIQIVIFVIHELAWDQTYGFLRVPFFSPGWIPSLADILCIAVVIYPGPRPCKREWAAQSGDLVAVVICRLVFIPVLVMFWSRS